MRKNLILFTLIACLITIFCKSEYVTSNIVTSLTIFEKKIFPSLFPLMVLSPFLINYGFLNIASSVFGPLLSKLFNISKNASYVVIMGILSGFPGSAIYSKELYRRNLITKEEIEKLVLFTHFSNPIFILTLIQNKPILILLTHYLTSIAIGIFMRGDKEPIISNNVKVETKPFFEVFATSIKNGIDSLLFILGVIVFFFMISSLIDHPITNIFLEISQGLTYIGRNIMDGRLSAAACCMLLSFGGLSVHVQTHGILSELGIKYLPYIKTRLLHALLSFIIVYLLYEQVGNPVVVTVSKL